MLTPEEQSNLDASAPLAVGTEDFWGLPAEITLAQWAIESEWGTEIPLGSNNPFGIKSVGTEPFVTVSTTEYVGGKIVTMEQNFRIFPTLSDAFAAHACLLTEDELYAPKFAKYELDHDLNKFIAALSAKYSTSPTYASDLIAMTMNPHITEALQNARMV